MVEQLTLKLQKEKNHQHVESTSSSSNNRSERHDEGGGDIIPRLVKLDFPSLMVMIH